MKTTERITVPQFVTDYRVRMTAERTDSNPHMPDSDNMDHWKCVLRKDRHSMTVYFSMGYGHHGNEPKVADVLDCLASDASGLINAGNFEDWASEYGYDTDSRKAEKTYKLIERQSSTLRSLLGDEGFEQLLWNTERL